MASARLDGSVTIPERFNGPPESGNGGYVCGRLAAQVGSGPARVSLRLPPPLGRPLAVERGEGTVALRDGERLVAEGEPIGAVEVEPPARPGLEEARRASGRYPWFERHVFPTCFVCGPGRPGRDGLGLYTGPADSGPAFAGIWEPGLEWERDGRVCDEIVWAALDCPSALPVMPADPRHGPPSVLARLEVSIEGRVVAGRPHAVVAWRLGAEGRKRHSASAILGEDGTVLARARALWVELRQDEAAPLG